jgi:uncharacterized membrane protein YkvA (DUF1232 family)
VNEPDVVEIELNPQERRVYDKVRARVVPSTRGRRSGLRDVLLLMPDLVILLLRLLTDPRVAPGDKAVALLGVGYVLSPIDLLPAFIFGPLGALDDVVVLTAALSRVLNHVHPDIVRQHWPGKGDVLDAVQTVSEWSERQVTGRIRSAVRRLTGG